MEKRSILLIAATCALLLCTHAVNSALRLRSASEVLRDPTNLLVSCSATERLGQDRIRFEVIQLLSDERVEGAIDDSSKTNKAPVNSGSDPEQTSRRLDVRVDVAADVKIGNTYIIGVSRYLRGRFPLPKWRLDPEGYRIIEVPVVGDALFTSSPDLKLLLTLPADRPDWSSRKILDPILRLLQDASVTNRRVAALELFFQPQLGEVLTPKENGRLAKIIENDSEEAVVRDYVLQATAQFPDRKDPDWVVVATRTVLMQAPLKVELGSATASFQHTSLRILKDRGEKKDLELAARMLGSTSSGVTLSALQTMEALDSQKALKEAKAALETKNLSDQSKRYLMSFIKRAEHKSSKRDDS